MFLSAAIIIKNAVKKTGPISYGEEGVSYNYYVKGDDLFTQTRSTFEAPTNEGEEVNEQITPEELRKEFYKGMQIMDSALAKAKGTISQEQWNALYAAVTKVEDMAEFIGDEEGFEGYGSTGF